MSIETIAAAYLLVGMSIAIVIHARDVMRDCSPFYESWALACGSSMAIVIGWPFAALVVVVGLSLVYAIRFFRFMVGSMRAN